MKLLNIIEKNFKILLRSKSSAFIIIFGPLFMIALISLALSNTQDYTITAGLVANEGELAEQFLTQLKDNEFTVIEYDDIESCIEKIKLGATNICIKLPETFEVDNENINNIEFHVDQSRINIVESIVTSVSSTIGDQSDEIALSLTQNLLDAIKYTSEELNKETSLINNVRSKIDLIITSSDNIQSEKDKTNLTSITNDISSAKTKINSISSSIGSLETETNDLLEDLGSHLGDIGDDSSNLWQEYNELKTVSEDEVKTINNATSSLGGLMDDIGAKVSSANQNLDNIQNSANVVKEDASFMENNIEEMEESISKTNNKISSLTLTSASNIVSPFDISISPIMASSNKSTFMFPYFLTLIILFVGIMLSSSLIIMEKKSKAFFKTMTTPTNEMYHVVGGYLTNIVIIFSQLIIVLTAAFFFLKIPLFENIFVTLIILVVSVSFFILLGSLIGHSFKTQEGVTMASISVGGLFLFLSNVVLPIESFPGIIRKILNLNPYTLSSELIKESILFNVGLSNLTGRILVLLGYSILTFIFVILIQKVSFNQMINSFNTKRTLQKPHVTNENYFKLQNGNLLKDKGDLEKALKKISEKEFSLYVNEKNNELALWLKDAFKDKKLAKEIRKAKSKKEIIQALKGESNIKKKDKKRKE